MFFKGLRLSRSISFDLFRIKLYLLRFSTKQSRRVDKLRLIRKRLKSNVS